MPAIAKKTALQITTVRIPQRLYEQARCIVRKGMTSSINDLLIESLEDKVEQVRRAEIDAQFAEMKGDKTYAKEAVAVAESFAVSDSQTLSLAHHNQE